MKYTFSDVKRLEEFLVMYEQKHGKKPRLTGKTLNGRITFIASAR